MQSQEWSLAARIRGIFRLDKALRLVWQGAPGWTVASTVLILAQSLVPVASVYLMKLVVDAVTASASRGLNAGSFGRIALLIAIAGAVALLSLWARSMTAVTKNAQSEIVTNHLHNLIQAKAIEADLECYEDPEFYDTLHRAQMEVGFRPTRIVDALVESARNGISLLMICGLLFSFDWTLTMVVLLAVVPDFLVRSRYGHILHQWRLERTEDERKAWLFHWMLTVAYYAKELRLYNLGRLFRERFLNLREKIRRERHGIFVRRGLAELVTVTLSTTAFYTAYTIIAYKCVYGRLTLGDMVMYYQSFQYAQEYFQGMMRSFAGLYEDNLFLSSLYQFLALERKVVPMGKSSSVPAPRKT